MSIAFTKYVDIISGVGGAALVAQRELIGRLFTTNELVPTKTLIEFTELADVGVYFGTTSEEYKRATFYFSWVSKIITTPQKIGFARWANNDPVSVANGSILSFSDNGAAGTTVTATAALAGTIIDGIDITISGTTNYNGTFEIFNTASPSFDIPVAFVADDATGTWDFITSDTAPQIFGEPMDQLLGSWTPILDGAFTLTLGVDTEVISGLDFSLAASLADVATIVEIAVQAANVATQWTGATVTYDAINKRFNLTGGDTGNAVVTVALGGVGTEIAAMLGWLNTGTILSDGSVAETITDVLTESSSVSNNFGSFVFMAALSGAEIIEAATWTDAQNVRFQYYQSILEVDAQTTFDAVKDIGGTGIILKSPTAVDEYPEMIPMNILAATDYTRRNANQNYMFQQFNISATVTDTTNSNALDALRVNYYGETQQAGRLLRFFQRGVLMGLATDPLDMNVYANEQWLKDAAGVAIMNLLLALSAVPANATGRSQILGALTPVITSAQFNGVISIGKPLTPTQIAFITQITGEADAWRQVQSQGYWIKVTIVPDPQNPGEFKAVYLLVYSKGDVVRRVEGTHTLI